MENNEGGNEAVGGNEGGNEAPAMAAAKEEETTHYSMGGKCSLSHCDSMDLVGVVWRVAYCT